MAKRTANFTTEEEQLLVSLVEKYKLTVECKKSGAVTWQEKEKAWKKIEEEFNSNNSRNFYRCVKNLKEKYLNLKKKAKQKFSANRQCLTQTGGGSCDPIHFTDVDVTIKNIIGKQIDGLNNPVDSDSCQEIVNNDENVDPNTEERGSNDEMYETQLPSTSQSNCVNSDVVVLEVYDDDDDEETEKEVLNDWSIYSSKDLKTAVSSKLKTTNLYTPVKKSKPTLLQKSNITKKYVGIQYELMQEKLNFVRLQKEKFLEEREIRMNLLKTKLEIKKRKLEQLNYEKEKQ